MTIDNPRTLEILKKRAGRFYTAAESEFIEKINNKKLAMYEKLDLVLNELYKFRVIQRTRKLTIIEKTQFTKLQNKKAEILKGV